MKLKKLYIPPTLIAYSILLMIFLYLFMPQFNLIAFPYNLIGLAISLSGFLLMGKARDLFKIHQTTLKIKKSDHLIKEGPFSKSRNPIYLGMSILVAGFSICSTNILALIFPFIFMILIRLIFIKREEEKMTKEFGEEYLAYKKEVRRWI